MTRRDDLAALEPVIDVLDALGIEHYIGGSVASSVHGVARTTLDIDIVANVDRERPINRGVNASPSPTNDLF